MLITDCITYHIVVVVLKKRKNGIGQQAIVLTGLTTMFFYTQNTVNSINNF